jgi:hypothetical protein
MKCGTGEGWRSVGTIVREMKKELQTIKQEGNILQTILGRNCLLKHGSEGKIEGRIDMTGT